MPISFFLIVLMLLFRNEDRCATISLEFEYSKKYLLRCADDDQVPFKMLSIPIQ